MNLAYCDKIADTIRKSLLAYDPQEIVALVGPIEWDLDPVRHHFVSTKKTIEVMDMNEKKYKVTVEEIV